MKLEQWGASEPDCELAAEYPQYELGRVVSQEKDFFRVVTNEQECAARVSGKFKYEVSSVSEFPAVGDFVLVERYLSSAWDSGAAPAVVLTKTDLCDRIEERKLEIEKTAIGVPVIETSGLTGGGLHQMELYLQERKTVAFIGSSGVGKSTLINRLLGEECLKTNTLRNDDKGRHTTTHRELFFIPGHGMVIDTPGMRELGMWNAGEGIGHTFADIEQLAEQCRFHNCTHTSEPGCAIRAALEAGIIDEERLGAYEKLKAENAYIEDSANYMAAKKKKFKEIAKYNKNNLKK